MRHEPRQPQAEDSNEVRRCEGATVRRCRRCPRVRGCEGATVRSMLALAILAVTALRYGRIIRFPRNSISTSQSSSPGRLPRCGGRIHTPGFHIDVKDESGKVVNWAFEMQPANAVPSWLAPDRCCRGHCRHRRGMGVAQRKSNGQYQHDCPFRRSTAVRWRSANRRRRSTSRRGRASLIGIELYPRRGL